MKFNKNMFSSVEKKKKRLYRPQTFLYNKMELKHQKP